MALVLAVVASASGAPARAAGPSWQDVTAATGAAAVPARVQHAMAADAAGNVYVFGGAAGGGGYLNDLWRLRVDTGTWEAAIPAGSFLPPPMLEVHLVADTNGDLYEFGGRIDANTLSNGLYRFEAATQQWIDLSASTAAAGVVPREDFGWALDPVGRQIYLFGGSGPPGYLNDFWRYDIASGTWTDLTGPSGSSAISRRELYNITYDGRGGFYLFGGLGYDAAGTQVMRWNDLWRYDVAAGVWRDLSAATGSSVVPGRHYYGQASDADGNFYVLGGWVTGTGVGPGAFVIGDFWKLDAAASTWVKADDAVLGGVLPRIPYNMAYQAPLNRLVIFGGTVDGQTFLNETWTLDLTGAIPPPTATSTASGTPTAALSATPTPTPTATPTASPTATATTTLTATPGGVTAVPGTATATPPASTATVVPPVATPTPPPPPQPLPNVPAVSTIVIGAAVGTVSVESADQGSRVQIPAGAARVDGRAVDVWVSLQPVVPPAVPGAGASQRAVQVGISTVDGTPVQRLARQLVVEMGLGEGRRSAQLGPRPAIFSTQDGATWRSLATAVDAARGVASASSDRPATFVLASSGSRLLLPLLPLRAAAP